MPWRLSSALDESDDDSETDSSSESDFDSESDDSSDNEANPIHKSPRKKVKFEHEHSWDDDIFRQSESQNYAPWDNSGRSSPVEDPESDDDEVNPGSIACALDNLLLPDTDQSESDSPDDDAPTPESTVEDIQLAFDFIEAVKSATLDNGDLDPETLARLRDPPTEPIDLSDPDLRFSLDIFISTTHASEEVYNSVRAACLLRNPADPMLSLAAIKKKVAEWSGVVPVLSHMCPNSCMAYTGPFLDRTTCRFCGTPRFDPISGAAQEFFTMPLGPQLQALYRSPESAKDMHYRREKTREILDSADADGKIHISVYEDYLHGQDYLDAVIREDIGETDIVVIGSMDGAQLYRNKKSDLRAVLPDSVIPGPNKPKHTDSFKFPSFHHLSALQKEGFRVWDAYDDRVVTSRPFLLLETADGPGMTCLNGLVGHHGVYGCRLYCPLQGRRKDGKPHYYPVMKLPTNYTLSGCSHPDVDPFSLPQPSEAEYLKNLQYLVESKNETEYKERRKRTGISKPSILSGLPRKHRLGLPGCCPGDIMHWAGLNWPDLVLGLFRGTMDCEKPDSKKSWSWAVLKGQLWQEHGKSIADAAPYLPTSFDRAPRNPAEKISSGYKAWEYILYLIGLAPALLDGILPYEEWRHFCKGVSVIRSFQQRHIPVEQIVESHQLACEYADEFEKIYFQGMPERIHFVRQSVHAMTHLAPECIRIGPPALHSQWPIERTIGNLGQEIKSHSQPLCKSLRTEPPQVSS
ncbi:hypothetical protein MSAN_00654800 [Mycena sanguinolenta]|uniref:Uncharacterized protein n=1 Tax=Mycena sanguinolenta TaxID=230812 RepID=A0A8H7DDC3_9AGAR|nr:hypothetical protein MSAN_00654800 [Mycena sanguinolenta]